MTQSLKPLGYGAWMVGSGVFGLTKTLRSGQDSPSNERVEEAATMDNRELLQQAYAAFNRRDIDAVLDLMSDDVDWPNAMEGTMVHGKDAVREYWKHQWEVADPRVDPVEITDRPDGKTVVRVNQVVKLLDGTLISEGLLDHEYQIKDGLIARMDVRDDAPGNRFTSAA